MGDRPIILAVSFVAALAVHVAIAFYADVLVEPWGGRPPNRARPTAVVPPVAQAPPDAPDMPPELPMMVLGERDGAGDASNASDAWDVAVARLEGPNQADLQRDAAGRDGRPAPAAPPASPRLAQSLPPTFSAPRPPVAESTRAEKFEPRGLPRPTKTSPLPAAAPPAPSVVPAAPAEPAKPALPPAPPQPPGEPAIAAGKPVEQSDRDSDLAGKDVFVDAKPGRRVARNGRGFKFARPAYNVAADADLAFAAMPIRLLLSVRIDPTGRVQSVEVIKSSGSRTFDRVMTVALYESPFDLKLDASGRAIAENTTIGFQWQ